MNLFSRFFNPARILSLIGHDKRRKDAQARRRELHDEMAARLGLPPIPWASDRGKR